MAEAVGTREGVQKETLKKELKMRHMTMISLGGVIGAGLIVVVAVEAVAGRRYACGEEKRRTHHNMGGNRETTMVLGDYQHRYGDPDAQAARYGASRASSDPGAGRKR